MNKVKKEMKKIQKMNDDVEASMPEIIEDVKKWLENNEEVLK